MPGNDDLQSAAAMQEEAERNPNKKNNKIKFKIINY